MNTKPFAVVTGASSGIGRELATQFAIHGFDLLIVAEGAEIDNIAEALKLTGANVESVQVDLASAEGVDTLWTEIEAVGRPLDAIAINAGVGVGGPFTDTDLESELNLMRLNVVSVVHLAKYVVQEMVPRGSGRILFTASIAATMPAPFEVVYGASKAFVLSFADGLRNELKDSGVTVTALMPGPTETNFFHRAGLDDTKVGASQKDSPEEVAKQGFKALMEGKAHIVSASFTSKMMGLMNELLPESVKAEQHRKLSEPGSAS